jgi:hypothetical protein
LSRSASGPLSWLKEGTFDVQWHLRIPKRNAEFSLHEKQQKHQLHQSQNNHDKATYNNFLELDLAHLIRTEMDVRVKYFKLNPPMWAPELNYLDRALIQPMAKYMSEHGKEISLRFDVDIAEQNFDGSWTPTEANLWFLISRSAYGSLQKLQQQEKERMTIGKAFSIAADYLGPGKGSTVVITALVFLLIWK